jgi:hypothetical protein
MITLSVKNGKVHVDPYYAHFSRGEVIEWSGPEGSPWAVAFKNNKKPTDQLVIHGLGAAADGKHVAKKRGHYPYEACLLGVGDESLKSLRGKPVIFLDFACPEIIID